MLSCNFCGKTYSRQPNLNKHLAGNNKCSTIRLARTVETQNKELEKLRKELIDKETEIRVLKENPTTTNINTQNTQNIAVTILPFSKDLYNHISVTDIEEMVRDQPSLENIHLRVLDKYILKTPSNMMIKDFSRGILKVFNGTGWEQWNKGLTVTNIITPINSLVQEFIGIKYEEFHEQGHQIEIDFIAPDGIIWHKQPYTYISRLDQYINRSQEKNGNTLFLNNFKNKIKNLN